jgi:hypothetical protein
VVSPRTLHRVPCNAPASPPPLPYVPYTSQRALTKTHVPCNNFRVPCNGLGVPCNAYPAAYTSNGRPSTSTASPHVSLQSPVALAAFWQYLD